MRTKIVVISLLVFSGCASINPIKPISRVPQSLPTLELDHLNYKTKSIGSVNLRTGIMREAAPSEFKGCVLYLEGLADSIRNHNALFSALSEAGYRVIAFDYMGQGGSTGSMNHTRIEDLALPDLEIGHQAKAVWEHFSSECSQSKKLVIGWSTGGLAAYRLAHEGWADSVVLIAPGIHPNKMVGEAANRPLLSGIKQVLTKQVITERTLTTNRFENTVNPHLDPINPISPGVVPLFAANLLATAEVSHQWKIPSDVSGLVFLSGKNDTYVDRDATKETLQSKAPHFAVKEYDGALHEIDNEIPSIARDMIARTVSFFDSETK